MSNPSNVRLTKSPMAFPDEDDLGRRSGARRRRDRRMPSPEPLDENDWSAESEYHRRPTPYRNREAKRGIMEPAESRPSSQRHTRESSSQPKPNVVMSVSRRPSAVPRRARDPHLYEHTSGTDSRRSSRKDNSPRYHISTPGSKRSSHTTVSDSDEESARTPSTEDDEPGRVPIERHRGSPKRESPHHRPRHSGARHPSRPKVPLVPKVPEVDELVDETSEEEDDDAEDESEDEDTEEEEEEIETVPRSRARPPRVQHIHEEEDIPSPSPSRHRGRYIHEEDIPLPSPSRHQSRHIHEEDIPSLSPPRHRSRHIREEDIPSLSPPRHRSHRILEEEIPSPSPSRRRRSTYRTHERLRDPPLSEDHYRPQSSRRTSRRTHGSDIVHVKHPAVIRRSNTTGGSHTPSTLSTFTRRSSFFDSILPRSARTTDERRTKIATCVECHKDLPAQETEKLNCNHRMCYVCLKHSFKLSLSDQQHMPPRCCNNDYIPLDHVEHLFDTNFKRTWERKFIENSARNGHLYCPSKKCGAWIHPEHIYTEYGRDRGHCSRCRTKVCGSCNGKWHSSRECPIDEATIQILDHSRDQVLARCNRCRAMVELKEGCDHMICRCGAQFCMVCGEKWKLCECPSAQDNMMVPEDYDHTPVPTFSRADTFPMSPPSRRYRGNEAPTAPPFTPRGHDFEEELMTRHPRDHRDRDFLARRFERQAPANGHRRERERPHLHPHPHPHGRERELFEEPIREVMRDDDYADDDDDDDYDYDGYDLDEEGEYRGSVEEDFGLGSRRRRGPHDGYRGGGDTVVPPSPPPTLPHGYDRTARTADYISDVSKARGVRGSSMERRLADRFSPQRTTQGPPPQSPIHGGHAHHPQPGLPPMAPMVPMVPMAPPSQHRPPPMAPAGLAPLTRRHTAEEDAYNMGPPPMERVVAGRGLHEYAEEVHMRMPPSRRHSEEIFTASTMAGLTGVGRGMNRVPEWLHYVEPGAPEDEQPTHRRRLHY